MVYISDIEMAMFASVELKRILRLALRRCHRVESKDRKDSAHRDRLRANDQQLFWKRTR